MKFKMTDEVKDFKEFQLYRIMAVKTFTLGGGVEVKEGTLGGWIQSEMNLSQEGNCWVADNAKVFGNALVTGDAVVCGDAIVHDVASVCDEAIVGEFAEVRGNATIGGGALILGNSIIKDNACIMGRAKVVGNMTTVGGNAFICANAFIESDMDYLTITPYGHDTTLGVTFFKNSLGGIDAHFEGDLYSLEGLKGLWTERMSEVTKALCRAAEEQIKGFARRCPMCGESVELQTLGKFVMLKCHHCGMQSGIVKVEEQDKLLKEWDAMGGLK